MKLTKASAFEVFQKNNLTQGLSEPQAREFFDLGRVVRVAPGTLFIHEGKTNHHMFMVLGGELEVFLPDTEERFSKVTMAKLGPGHYVGEYSFLDACPASASVKTLGECVLFQIDHSEAESLFEQSPETGKIVYRNLLVNLVNRLRQSSQELDLVQPFA